MTTFRMIQFGCVSFCFLYELLGILREKDPERQWEKSSAVLGWGSAFFLVLEVTLKVAPE